MLDAVLQSFKRNFNLHPVIGVEWEFLLQNDSHLQEMAYEISKFENIKLLKEKNENQYEIIIHHTAKIFDLINQLIHLQQKFKNFISICDIKKKFLAGCICI